MHWFTDPPYWRWVAAALLVVAAFAIELRPRPTVAHPFVVRPIAAGEPITAEAIEFRTIPADVLPAVESYGYALRAIGAGEPLTPGTMTDADPIPEDWWLVTVPLPDHVIPGTPARLVLATGVVDVLVATPGRTDGFDARTFGTVAVPPSRAADVARAASDNSVVVLTRP